MYKKGQGLWQHPGCSQPLTWWGCVGLASTGSTQSLWPWPRGCTETPARATVTWTFPTWFLGREKGRRALLALCSDFTFLSWTTLAQRTQRIPIYLQNIKKSVGHLHINPPSPLSHFIHALVWKIKIKTFKNKEEK